MIKGVFFDMGGTLIANNNLSFDRVYDCLLKYIPNLSKEYYEVNVVDKLVNRDDNEIAFLSLLIKILNEYRVMDVDVKEIELDCNRNLCDYELIDGVVEYLEKLKADGLKMMVLSNSCFSKSAIIDILKSFGLMKYFDSVIVSSLFTNRKPNERLYKLAIQEMGYKPGEIVMIGNSYEADIIGSSNVGLYSMFLDDNNEYRGFENDHLLKVFHKYSELMKYEIIDELILKKRVSYEALKVINILKKNGYEAYIVGGCVRNALMDIPFNDYDITTSAMPSDVKRIFSENGYKVVPTGEKHGTITVIENEVQYEVTTYRSDGAYLDSRHPKDVILGVPLEEDLKRRDFTINTLCYDGENIIDLLNGKKDIIKGVVRAVGEPVKRFEEDALRILRALRFAITLGFKIEKETERAILDNYTLIKYIAIERVNEEIYKMLPYPCLPVFTKYKKILEYAYDYKMKNPNLEKLDTLGLSPEMKFAIFGPKLEYRWSSLKFASRIAAEIITYQKLDSDINYTLYSFRRDLCKYGREQQVKNCIYLAKLFDWDEVKTKECKYYYVKSQDMPINVNELNIDGNEIKRYGIRNVNIKRFKEEVLDLILLNEIDNTHEDIKHFLDLNSDKFM